MKTCIIFLLAFFALNTFNVTARNYTVDDQSLDKLFSESKALTFQLTDISPLPGDANYNATALAGDKDPLLALVLDFFLGGLGVHRFYLGTEFMTGLGYLLTCGGIFGIVPIVDFIVLVINFDDISPYIDNPAFFMWN